MSNTRRNDLSSDLRRQRDELVAKFDLDPREVELLVALAAATAAECDLVERADVLAALKKATR